MRHTTTVGALGPCEERGYCEWEAFCRGECVAAGEWYGYVTPRPDHVERVTLRAYKHTARSGDLLHLRVWAENDWRRLSALVLWAEPESLTLSYSAPFASAEVP